MRRQDYIARAGVHQGLWKKAGKIGKPLAPFCFLAPHRSTDSFPKVLQSAYVGMWQTGYLIPNQIFSWRNLIVLLGLSIHPQSHPPLCVVERELSGFRDHFQRRCPFYCKYFVQEYLSFLPPVSVAEPLDSAMVHILLNHWITVSGAGKIIRTCHGDPWFGQNFCLVLWKFLLSNGCLHIH